MMYNVDMAGRTSLLVALTVCGMLLLPQTLCAQGRKAVYLSTPGGNVVDVGRGANSVFTANSYGMGSLNRYSSATSDVLRSSNVTNRRTYDPTGSSGVGDLAPLPSGTYTKRPTGIGMPSFSPSDLGTFQSTAKARTGGPSDGTGAYLSTITNATSLPASDQPITTLVPSEPSMYKVFMERGESAFRNSEYHRAFGEFQLANDIGGNDWMSLFSLTNSRFATSSLSYYSAAHYAMQTIKSFPELPLLPIRPKEFFGDKNKYSDCILELEGRVDKYPYDPDAALLLAYFQWFEPNPALSQQTLSKALAAATATDSPAKVEVIKMFWRGIVRTGKASGELTPATLPAKLDTRTFVDPDEGATSAPAATQPATQPN